MFCYILEIIVLVLKFCCEFYKGLFKVDLLDKNIEEKNIMNKNNYDNYVDNVYLIN